MPKEIIASYGRKLFRWKTTLQAQDGQVVTREIATYWSPEWDGIETEVAIAASCEQHVADPHRRDFACTSVERI